MDNASLDRRARSLVEKLAVSSQTPGIRSCTPTIYDTAWFAMLPKSSDSGEPQWMFPQACQFLLDRQQSHGGWTACDSKVDTILNTLAATLALKRHSRGPGSEDSNSTVCLNLQVARAITFLQKELSEWEMELDTHQGPEILIPALLSMLEREDVYFHFPCRTKLMALNNSSLAHFDHETSKGSERSPIRYFLEAFVESADLKNLNHHTAHGSIMSSPSATAGYVMGREFLDEDSESYLRAAVRASKIEGGVPAVFPCKGSEHALTMNTLLENGFSEISLNLDLMKSIAAPLQEVVSIITVEIPSGFGLYMESLFTQYLLCKMRDQQSSSLELEELEEHLMTHVGKHSTGFNTRCKILKALLRSPRLNNHESYASSMIISVCDSWWSGNIKDPEHLSPYYSMMLFTDAFAELHRLSESNSWLDPLSKVLHERASVVIVQILARVLSEQNNDGTWGVRNCAETTAYGLLALIAIASLPYVQFLMLDIRYAVARGRQALSLMLNQGADPHPLWVGKVAYGSANLSETYSLAAMKKPFVEPICSKQSKGAIEKQTQRILGFANFFSSLEYMSKEPLYMVKLSVLEASFYRQALQAMRADVFPATQAKENDKYLDYVPIMWVLPNTCNRIFSAPEYLLDMMVLSMYVFLVDEYMESNVAKFSKEEFAILKASLEDIHPEDEVPKPDPPLPDSFQGSHSGSANNIAPSLSERLQAAITVFRTFATYVCSYPRVASASPTGMLELQSETKNYLLYHLIQIEDNARLAQQPSVPSACLPRSRKRRFLSPRSPYHTWVHTIGAGHVSGPWSFAFFICSISGSIRSGRDCFSTVTQKLMAYKMNAHYGAFCRMYNDYGSINRDHKENNLNSVNFPEFFPDEVDEGNRDEIIELENAKATLLEAANYERQRALETAQGLYGELEKEGEEGRRVRDCLRAYIGAGEQFSDMYVTRDVTNSVK